MSFNRLKYDNCEVKKYNEESTGPGDYMTGTPIMCDNCFNDNPWVVNQKNGVSIDGKVDWRFYSGPVDVESELFNITRKSSRCPSKKYEPSCAPNSCDNQGAPCGQGAVEKCVNKKNPLKNSWNRPEDYNLVNFPTCHFPTSDTRLNNPPSTLRGTGWNRFDPLCKDPQQNVTFPGTYMTPTRLVFKDNHRPVVINPKVNDMNPYEKMENCQKIDGGVCANPTQPLYQYDVCG
jgi:hypothetical protein